jgi:hypothetical protein
MKRGPLRRRKALARGEGLRVKPWRAVAADGTDRTFEDRAEATEWARARGGKVEPNHLASRRAPRWRTVKRPPIPQHVLEAVNRRSGGCCEARLPGCTLTVGLQYHHRLRRSQGGRNDEATLVRLCAACHQDSPAAVHRNPAAAYRSGLLIRASSGTPSESWVRPENLAG